jgi:S-DNA-T family DNA segregation ATPase FtsK/SpoIIIE
VSKPRKPERSILTEALALGLIAAGLLIALSLVTYDPADPSFNVSSDRQEAANLVGRAGAWIADMLFQAAGILAVAIPVVLVAFGIRGFAANRIRASLKVTAGLAVAALALAGFLSLFPVPDVSWLANTRATGGLVGMLVSQALVAVLNPVGAGIVLALTLVVTAMLTLQFSLFEVAGRAVHGKDAAREGLGGRIAALRERFSSWRDARAAERERRAAERLLEEEEESIRSDREREERRRTEELVREGLMDPAEPRPRVRRTTAPLHPEETGEHVEAATRAVPRTDRLPAPSTILDDLVDDEPPFEPAPEPVLTPTAAAVKARLAEVRSKQVARAAEMAPPPNGGSRPAPPEPPAVIDPDVAEMVSTASIVRTAPAKPAAKQATASISTETGYKMPSTELLAAPPASSEQDERQLEERAIALAEKCKEFSVTGHIHRINPGPVVTTFEFKPDPGIKYSRVVGLADDLCLALKAESIRIDRIPGKSTVGIEVPNHDRQTIFLREIIESHAFQSSPSKLTLALGHTIDGQDYVADLQKMPHLLIAGSTGSGKSVMINAIVTSILYKAAPDEVKFIMVDPKRLELGLYEGIPHLLTPIVVDPKRAANALKWAVAEMENRYRHLAGYGVRNIEQYNKEVRAIINQRFAAESEELPKPLPYIVVLIDELADLMMVASSEVESSITRLAQMARAIGIHLVLATQRPSVDVITGLIKANFPSRMSFRVSSKVDSRTIIDTNGAEQLLGQGDMLFLPPGTSRLVRVHGSFLSEKDVKDVTTFIKQQGEPEYDDTVTMTSAESGGIEGGGDRDELFEDALKIVCDMNRASTSVLQRRLRIGYGRAAAILDQMEQAGFVGPPDGSRPRTVLRAAYEFYERNDEMIDEKQDE